MQPEVVVGTESSVHVPATSVAFGSAGVPEVVAVADDCSRTGSSEVVGAIDNLSAARRRGRSKVRFDSVYRSEDSEFDSDIEDQRDPSRKKYKDYRSHRRKRSPSRDRPEVHIRGREIRLGTTPENSTRQFTVRLGRAGHRTMSSKTVPRV